jgi:hypothetical protein
LPHPLVVGKDKAYHMFLVGMVRRESFASKVHFDENINNFLTPTNIF